MDQLSDKILKDYLLGRCSTKELEEIDRWIQSSEANAKWLFSVEDMYYAGKHNPYADPAKIQRAEIRLFQELSRERQERRRIHIQSVLRYAAVFFGLVLMGVFIYYYQGDTRMVEIASTNQVKEVTLPDGTHVWLNKSSRLKYPVVFGTETRKVELEGEALFHVTKDKKRPFLVKGDCLETRVLGTVFNFNTQGKGGSEEVTLQEGKVMVVNLRQKGLINLKPNQKAIFDKATGAMAVEMVYAPSVTVWHNNMIPFVNMRITEIASVLEKIYHVKITIAHLDKEATYTGDVRRSESIDTVLENLSYSIPFKYQIEGNQVKMIGK